MQNILQESLKNMLIKEITSKAEWQQFIEAHKPSTFLHTWQWGEFEKTLNHPIFRLGIYDNNNLVCVTLFSLIKARRGSFLLCPHGPIIDPIYLSRLHILLTIIREKAIEIGKKEKVDFIRMSTLIPLTPENLTAFKKAGFRDAPIHMHSELAWITDISGSEEDILKGMKKNHRYSIKKAEKDGVTVRKVTSYNEKDFELFWTIYMSTVARQKFTPYGKEYLRKEFELFFADNQAVLLFAEYQNKAISTAFVVYANGSGYYHHGASDNTFPGITPSEFLQWEAIKEARVRGMQKYNFWGIVPETAVKHPWHGLSKFKRGFGGYAEEYVHAQDYILTPKYWIAYIIEKARKIKRGL
jgi:peptidoglycan pentaglycine glycine transferase (the first glycine)